MTHAVDWAWPLAMQPQAWAGNNMRDCRATPFYQLMVDAYNGRTNSADINQSQTQRLFGLRNDLLDLYDLVETVPNKRMRPNLIFAIRSWLSALGVTWKG